jgi:D-alanyl-D-alanine carboxypeptidase-like protein
MVVRSQNGWTANDRSVISTRTVRGTSVRLAVRNGPAGDLLLEVAALFDLMVQDLDQPVADDWGYAERPIRGTSDVVSNHASGTAVDLNATRWPLGSRPEVNLSAAQIATVRTILGAATSRGRRVVRWGGDYTGRKDPMHFEIADGMTEADCATALAALRAHFGRPPGVATEEDDLTPDQDRMLRVVYDELTKRLPNRRGPNGETIPGGGGDTTLGYSANADGFGFRAAAEIAYLHQKLDWLHDNIPAMVTPSGGTPIPPAIDYDQLAAAFLRTLAGRTG